jgi:CRISPR-associated protein Cmr2
VRGHFQSRIKSLSGQGDTQFVSNFYTLISRLVELKIEGSKEQQDIWRDLFENFRPDYPASPIGEESLLPTRDGLEALPDGSWLISLKMKLQAQFTSKDESDFHFSNNPIVRDRLTGLPMVRPTTWKGHLRFAARVGHGVPDKDREPETMKRLFGETRGEEGGRSSRLHFFPTFFTENVQREVITPLKRDRRTPARGPIDIEVVPAGVKGTFCLLYIPYPKGLTWSLEQIAHDLEEVGQALKAMFLEYGFSAKKTAGWGVVHNTVEEGFLWAKGTIWPSLEKRGEGDGAQPFERPDDTYLGLMDEAGMPKAVLRKPDGTWISNKEFNALANKPCSLSVYRRFRSWYDTHGAAWQRQLAGAKAASASMPIQTYTIESVTALCELATDLAEAIRREDANG